MLSLARRARHHLEDLVEALQPTQRRQCGAVHGMFPRAELIPGKSSRVVAGGSAI